MNLILHSEKSRWLDEFHEGLRLMNLRGWQWCKVSQLTICKEKKKFLDSGNFRKHNALEECQDI